MGSKSSCSHNHYDVGRPMKKRTGYLGAWICAHAGAREEGGIVTEPVGLLSSTWLQSRQDMPPGLSILFVCMGEKSNKLTM